MDPTTRRESTLMITPELATTFLATLNPEKQRQPRPVQIEIYARDMKAGAWIGDMPDPIMFHRDGWLANGQHRLRAVVKSGTAQQFRVRWGCTTEEIARVDTGIVRPAFDRLRIAHGERYTKRSIAVARSLRLLMTGDTEITDDELRWIVDRAWPFMEPLLAAVTSGRSPAIFAPHIAVMTAGMEIDPAPTRALFDRVCGEVSDGKGDPAHTMLELLRERTRGGAGDRLAFMRAASRVWRAQCAGESIRVVRDSTLGLDFIRSRLAHTYAPISAPPK